MRVIEVYRVECINNCNEVNINKLVEWMYNWWSEEGKYSKETVAQYMKYSFNSDNLPKTIVAFNENNEEIAMCHITTHDMSARPDLYPWIANLYVDPAYRGNKLVKVLLDKAIEETKKLNINCLYIYTEHVGLYEKYGWEYIEDIYTFFSEGKQRLYRYNIK